jgi:NitT/TauT family transport system substrate-binding protein
MRNANRFLVPALAGGLVLASFTGVTAQTMKPVTVQLQWVVQAQFAGFYAAKAQGFWAARGLDVTLQEADPTGTPPQVIGSDPNGPEFTTTWVPRALAVIDKGQSDLVDIAQVFQRSGTREVSWAPGKGPDPVSDATIASPADWKGKKVGVWDFGNDYEIIAAARKAGLEANVDYERVIQAFDMSAFLTREIDAASGMIYNEYAQILEATDPKTGALYQPSDLNVIDFNDPTVATAMLQDAIWSRASWLSQPGNEEVAVQFLAGAFEGWIYCRDHPADCVQYMVDAGSILGNGHQAWMMNEINPLIWPSTGGIGSMPVDTWNTTVQIALDAAIIAKAPAEGTYRTDLADAARALVTGDAVGANFVKGTVPVTPKGE